MSKYFAINLSGTGPSGAVSIYITHNGLVGGRTCKTELPEADLLITANPGNTTVGNSGNPFTEKPLVAGQGIPFTLRIPNCPSALYTQLRTLIDYVDLHEAEIRMTATGVPGNIDVDFSPNHAPVPIGFDSFSTGNVKGVQIRGIVSDVN